MKSLILAIALLLVLPFHALGFGEIFKIETSGTEYCGDFDVVKFNANSNVDLWVQLVSESELTVSLTSNFAPGTTFPMFGQTYLTGPSSGGFVGGVLFVDGSYATIQGTARFDRRTGAVTNLTGTFIQNGVLELQCFSSGRFSGKRVM